MQSAAACTNGQDLFVLDPSRPLGSGVGCHSLMFNITFNNHRIKKHYKWADMSRIFGAKSSDVEKLAGIHT